MQRIIGVTELQRHFRSVFDEVVKQNIDYILTRGSRPEAVLIPYEDFIRFQELDEKDVLVRFDHLVARMAEQNANISDEELSADISAALEEVDN